MTNSLLLKKLEWLYKNEINFSIETFFDAGVLFKLGDATNGFADERYFEISDFEKGVYWLCEAAKSALCDDVKTSGYQGHLFAQDANEVPEDVF